MQAQPEESIEPHVETAEDKAEKKRKQVHKCCTACQAALDKDRSGDAPDKIPCADFTADLDEGCRKWFVKNPMMAAKAKQCVADNAPPAAAPPATEGEGAGEGAGEAAPSP
jgi:hypothetical protein